MIVLKAGSSGSSAFADEYDFLDDEMEEGDAYALEDLIGLVLDMAEDDVENPPERFSNDEDILLWGLSSLCQSETGRVLAFDARYEDWSLEVDDIESGRHILDTQLRILILPRMSPNAITFARTPECRQEFLLELIRGLRAIWHSMNGVRTPFNLGIEETLLWERIRRADHDLAVLSIAWDMHEEGDAGFWRYLIGSDLGDLAIAFRAMVDRHPDMLRDGSLLTHLTIRWMDEETRINEIDHVTLSDLDEKMKYNGLKARIPTKALEARDVTALSQVPNTDNVERFYLAPIARTLLSDPFFRRVPDPLNEAHMRQIEQDRTPVAETLGFHDQDLARKIFPHHIINTIV